MSKKVTAAGIARELEAAGHKVVRITSHASCKKLHLADGRAVIMSGSLPYLAIVGDAHGFNGDVAGFLAYLGK